MTQPTTAMQAAFIDLAMRHATLVSSLCRIQDATGLIDDGATIFDLVGAIDALADQVNVLNDLNSELIRKNERLQVSLNDYTSSNPYYLHDKA